MPSIDPSISQNPQLYETQQTHTPTKGTATQKAPPRQTFGDTTRSMSDDKVSRKSYEQGPEGPKLTPPEPGTENMDLRFLFEEIRKDEKDVTGEEMSQLAEENEELVETATKKTSKKHEEGAKKPKGDGAHVQEHNGSKPHTPLDDHVSTFINNEIENRFISGEIGRYSSEFEGMTEDEIKEALRRAYSHPQSVPHDSPIHELMKAMRKGVKDAMDVAQTFKSQKDELSREAKTTFENNFTIILEGFDAPLKDKQAVLYAFNNNHGSKEKLTSAQKTLYHDVSAEAMVEVDQLYGVRRAPHVDGGRYNAIINNDYVQRYEAALKSNLNNGTLTQDLYLSLRTRLYYPDSVPVNDSAVAIEKAIQSDSLSGTIAAYGIPSDWQPTVSTILFDAIANGTWRDTFDNLVNEDTTLDADAKAQIIAARANPESLPTSLRMRYDALHQGAQAHTMKIMHLPPTWKVSELEDDPNLDPKISLLLNGAKTFFSQLKDIHYTVMEQANVPIADKGSYMSYLAIIGSALSELQELIYLIESSNAKMSKMMNGVLLDAQLSKIEKAKQEAEAQRDAQEASKGKAVINVMGKILGPVLAVLTVVAALAMAFVPPASSLAPLLIGIAIVMVTLSVSKAAGFDIMSEGFKALDSMMESILPEGPLCLVAQAMVKAVIVATVIIACCICGPGGVLLAMNLGVEALLSSNVVANIVEACGGGEMAQMIATMIVMVVVMVALLGVMIFSMAGAASAAATTVSTAESTGASATQGTAQAASVTQRAIAKARLVTEQLKNYLKAFFPKDPEILAQRIKMIALTTSTIANSTYKIAESAANINMYMKLAELAQRIANLKANQEEKDAVIKTLRMAINSLQSEIGNMAEFLNLINKFQSGKFYHMQHVSG